MLTKHLSLRCTGQPPALLLSLALVWQAAAPGALLAGDDALTLRINDTTAEPGGRVAVVLRTYASRGVGQGQIIVRVRPKRRGVAPSGPFVALEQAVVFSAEGDASPVDVFDSGGQTALVEFDSPSATVCAPAPFSAPVKWCSPKGLAATKP